ncbi:hypothetical protein PUN28_003437 [Cardiocondyla obscurior]|uniref:Uncharacterized protein n=1 Tax=Cardiocondyla obscurior TaxID=286306 RepID=A0AAW2GNV1_9HYME
MTLAKHYNQSSDIKITIISTIKNFNITNRIKSYFFPPYFSMLIRIAFKTCQISLCKDMISACIKLHRLHYSCIAEK